MQRLRRWASGGPSTGPLEPSYSRGSSSVAGATASVSFQLPDGTTQRPAQKIERGTNPLVGRWCPSWCAARKQRTLHLDERYRSAANRVRIIHALKTAVAAVLASLLEVCRHRPGRRPVWPLRGTGAASPPLHPHLCS